MRVILIALAAAVLCWSGPAMAQQAAPFCLVSNTGNKSCFYYSLQACQQAAATLGGMCSPNSGNNSNPQPNPIMQIQHPDIAGQMREGYRAGAEEKRRREEHAARMRLIQAQAEALESQAAAARTMTAPPTIEPKPLYRCIGQEGLPTYTVRKLSKDCKIIFHYTEVESPPPSMRPRYFHGYPCSQDCSGHRAGYEWAEAKGVKNEGDCTGRSQSFIEGCRAYVAGEG